jgi:hypothetical protein
VSHVQSKSVSKHTHQLPNLTRDIHRCKYVVYGDPIEHNGSARILVCKRFSCQRRFCASCRQRVRGRNTRHSCDGSLEAADLARRRGYRTCPGSLSSSILIFDLVKPRRMCMQALVEFSLRKWTGVTTCRFALTFGLINAHTD